MAGYEGVRLTTPEASASPATAVLAAPPVRRRATPPQPAVLQVGSADDALEHAADRAADAAMARITDDHEHGLGHSHPAEAAPAHAPQSVRRRAAVGREGGATSTDFTHRVEGMRSGGRTLDTGLRRSMEHGFGTSLSGVRVHTGAAAADAAAEIGALAFTTGRDIFFGEGQYRPGTPDGDHMIGHEIAHTLQQSGSAKRISRRWDFESPNSLPISDNTSEVRVLAPRAVFIIKDKSGDAMVVKAEDRETGLASLVGDLHAGVTGAKTVRYRRLEAEETGRFINVLREHPEAAEKSSWAKMVSNHGVYFGEHLPDNFETLSGDAAIDAMRNGVASYLVEGYLHGGTHLQAMTVATGDTAEKSYGAPEVGGNKPAQNAKMRGALDSPGHMRAVGKMTTLDFITGNEDRFSGGNWGNYFVDQTGVITVIDNIDKATQLMWGENRHATPGDSTADTNFDGLRPSQIGATATKLITDFFDYDLCKWDAGAKAWLDEVDPVKQQARRDVFLQEFYTGMVEARHNFIKVFTSTRWSLSSAGKQARKTKKALKGSAKDAQRLDAGSLTQEDYYERLKQIALILKRQK